MRLLQTVHVEHFRSLGDIELVSLGDFTAVAGLNSSGKSNLLRALNAFFRGETDPQTAVDVDRDHNVYAPSRKKRRIRVGVGFDLPEGFNFRKELEDTKRILGSKFEITKEWTRDQTRPAYYLNSTLVEESQRGNIDQFLALINFRYIPNRVLPLDVIRLENRRLRDAIIKRLATTAKDQTQVFKQLAETSRTLFSDLEQQVRSASEQLESVRLATPGSWQDLVFAFGYRLGLAGKELDDTVQGSGIQSLLMLATLALIDCDYKNWFGWKQATVWAFEEPESSLHALLEARVASLLAELSANPKNRLQILCTTHSDLVIQYADRANLFALSNGTTSVAATDKAEVLKESAQHGVTRWVHPILAFPLNPVILVEGKFDYDFLHRALAILRPGSNIRVAYLQQLKPDSSGGVEELRKYLEASKLALHSRIKEAPVIVLLDWDAARQKTSFEKIVNDASRLRIECWPDSAFNSRLSSSFRGVERSFSDRLIDTARLSCEVVAMKNDGTLQIHPSDAETFKRQLNFEVCRGITSDDLIHCRPFLLSLFSSLSTS